MLLISDRFVFQLLSIPQKSMKKSHFCGMAFAIVCLLGSLVLAQNKAANSRLLNAVVSKPMGICYVDVNRCADVVQRLLKANPELQKELEGSFMNDDFFNAVRCLGAKVVLSFQDFSDFDNDQFAVAVQVDEKIPLNTMWKGFAPLFEDDLPEEFSMPASGENILLFGEVSQRKEMEENLANGQVLPSMVLEGIPADAMLYCVLSLDILCRQLSYDMIDEADDICPSLARVVKLLEDALGVNFSWAGFGDEESNGSLTCNLAFRQETSAKEFSEALLEFRDFLIQDLAHEADSSPEMVQMIFTMLNDISVEANETIVHCEVNHVEGGVILAGILLPALAQSREKSRQLNCATQMKQCLLGLIFYAEDHDDKLLPPADISDMSKEFLKLGYSSREILDCPVNGTPYRYFGNEEISYDSIEHPPRTILMVCQGEHEQVVVGFADGHVECMDAEQLQNILKQCESGKLPVVP